MENLYSIRCALFPKNKIIEVLKYNNFYFSPVSPKPQISFGEYLSFNEDKMAFVEKAIILKYHDSKIIIGNTYREDMNDTPNADKINIILEKINKSGLDSLSIEEITFLRNNSSDF